MKQNQLDRIIRLVKRTGDRFVVLDRATDEAMVVMNLNEYEDLLNTTTEVSNLAEEEMLSRLNHDINRWQEQNEKRTALPQIEYEEPLAESEEEVEQTKEYEVDQTEPKCFPEVENLAEISEDLEDSELDDLEEFVPAPVVVEPALETVKYVSPVPEATTPEIPVQANFAEEDLSNLPEGEEEKFYLEPIE